QPSGIDLNGDGDTTDDVVQLWTGVGAPLNLGRAATAIALSDHWLAALVSEAGQGHTDFNRDGGTNGLGVQGAPGQGTRSASWINVGQAADTLDVAGSIVAFITPSTEGRVLQVYDADAKRLLMGPRALVEPQPVQDFVLGPRGLVGFRSPTVTVNGVVDML